ncbi:hypothetical protein C1J03_22375 [Sulfitobacter sp. SK012]|uniref:class I adenylate-forming enzyme family protein n=1 Tax=Sulfitobacter sp. SK012 TaxID=1389005 RepID=UPI000E0AF344|nr:class I adenylate-forming enzyme family protein [Sulfitobacter sp. SK012]AXI48499.1 hypothetical protein C1J03_22375 [Sulfitobacter sp. SK012]
MSGYDYTSSKTAALLYDSRTGIVETPAGHAVELSPNEQAVMFWRSSGLPMSRLQQFTGQTLEDLSQIVDGLARKLRCGADDIPAFRLEFRHGKGPRPSEPWAKRTMSCLVWEALNNRPADDPFIVDARGDTITAGEVLDATARIRSALRNAGVGKGDIIGADSTLSLETYLITLAAWMHGAPLIRMDSNAAPGVVLSQLERTPAKIVFSARTEDLASANAVYRLIALPGDDPGADDDAFLTWISAAPAPSAQDRAPAEVDPADLCLISSTSGSTGTPKSVLLSHQAFWFANDRSSRMGSFSDTDIFSSVSDFVGGYSTALLTGVPLLKRARVMIPRPSSRGSPLDYAMDCSECRVTCAMIGPSALRSVIEGGERFATPFLNGLSNLCSTAAPFGETLVRDLRALSRVEIAEHFGSREYGGSLSARTTDLDVITAGGGFENEALVRVVDDNGDICGIDQIGHLLVVSLGLMDGYVMPEGPSPHSLHDNPQRLSAHEMWYRTGDLASYTATGKVKIAGRSSDLMKAPDGQIVMPIEIENILHADDRVLEASVFSVKDEKGLECIAGAIIPGKGQDQTGLEFRLRQRVQEVLGHLKTPRILLIMDTFPRAAQNKPDKNRLKSLCEEKLNPVSHENAAATMDERNSSV